MAVRSDAERADRALWPRLGALAVAAWWAVPFFGIIDLLVGIIPSTFPDEYDWTPVVVVSTSWGLLFSVLVPMPLIAWGIRPMGWVGPQLIGVAGAVLVTGLAATSWGQVLVAVLIAASGAFPPMWRPRPVWPARQQVASAPFWAVHSLLALGFGIALLEAWRVLDAARNGAADDVTWGLMHLPMQAGFTLAVAVSAAVGVWAMANRVVGWWFAIVPSALSAVWFGAICAKHPDLSGSLGTTAAWGSVTWGIAIAVAVWATGYRTRPRHRRHARV